MSTRPVGASVGLSRSRVLRAAVDVADRDGLDGVSMRRLAALPLKIVDGRMMAGGGFQGRIGFRRR